MRVTLYISILLLTSFCSYAQIPSGYYDDANGKTGYTLKTSLYNTIKGHTDKGYSALWDLYETSDKRADGFVWDIYSDCNLEFVNDQDPGSGGTVECDKFNREHTFPQSWFGGSGIMRNDPFHVLPTDKKVNGIRGNFAYGEVSNPSYTSLNKSKLGPNTIAGHLGTVFEPIDEYKGDIARGYFYMATRYEDIISGWETNDSDGGAMLNGTSDQVYENWALEMLIAWHNTDPVSPKEIDRNNVIYEYQNNRNPFIDHPEYVASIWRGGETSNPSINITASLMDFGSVAFGEVSATQSYIVSGTELTSDIDIISNNGFEISLMDIDSDYTTSLTLTKSSGLVTTTSIFVRFKPTSDSNSSVSGTITHSSNGVTDLVLPVNGTEYHEIIPEINFSFSSRSIDPVDQYEVRLFANEAPIIEDITILIKKTNSTGLVYGDNYSTTPVLVNDVIALNWLVGQLDTTFYVNFVTSQLSQLNPRSLNFKLVDNSAYTIGSNDSFDLTLKTITSTKSSGSTELKVYPNPSNGHITIDWVQNSFEYFVSDLSGRVLETGHNEYFETLDLSNLTAGEYILKVVNNNKNRTYRLSIY